MNTELEVITGKKWNNYSHARHHRSNEDMLIAQSVICGATLDTLRVANVEFIAFLKKKITFHRSNKSTFHNERASAYDAALQELTQLLQEASYGK